MRRFSRLGKPDAESALTPDGMESGTSHATGAGSVFDVWATYDSNGKKPHYPSFRVSTRKVGSSLDLDGAERIVRETVRMHKEDGGLQRLHSLRITATPLGRYCTERTTLSEYAFDRDGNPVERRTIAGEGAVFKGRDPDGIRFREGDLCEVLDGDKVYLGFVAGLPPTKDLAAGLNGTAGLLEASDDCYLVMTGADSFCHELVDSLRIFCPQYRISPRTEKRLRDAYNDVLTSERRMEIMNASAAARLRGATAEYGWSLRIRCPEWEDGMFELFLEGVRDFPDGLDLRIRQKKTWYHMDRILIMLKRLAGEPSEGRGYRLKRLTPLPSQTQGQKDTEKHVLYTV